MRIPILLLLAMAAAPALTETVDVRPFAEIPVMHGDKLKRVKPIDSMARETVYQITGKERFGIVSSDGGEQRIAERMDCVALMLDWVAHRDAWENRPTIAVPRFDVREKLGLNKEHRWCTPAELRAAASCGRSSPMSRPRRPGPASSANRSSAPRSRRRASKSSTG